jgi:photosystem II stability/assembly factor-like uncharacterized protein
MKKLQPILLTLVCLFVCVSSVDAQRRNRNATPQAQNTPDLAIFDNISIRNIAPAKTSGRITQVAVNPQNRSIRYAAGASGNVWKTVNAGTTWEPIFDRYGSFSIGTIVIDPNNPNVVWLGSGENNSQRSVGYGDGVYKSTDAGKSWTNMGLKTSEHIGKIIINPENSNEVYVASQGPLWAAGGERGLYKTSDGGRTWDRILNVSENTGVSDLAMDPRNPNVLYATSYQRRRHFGILVAGGPESAVYKSTDGGANWRKLRNGLPGGDLGRIAVAISPQKPDVVYALVVGTERTKGFYRSSDMGESWVKKSDYQVIDPQYYVELFPDPNQFDRVLSVDMRTMVTIDGGSTFDRINEDMKHVDSHDVVFDPNDPNYIMIGCDGGIYESWDNMNTWRFTDNMPLTQLYRVGLDNDAPFYNIYGGTQDNASFGGPSQTINRSGIVNADWYVTTGGDGFQVRVDPTNPDIIYTMSQYAGIVRFDKKSGERIDIQPQPAEGEPALKWNWDAPLLVSPHNPKRMYYAANKVFKTEDHANTWTRISDDLTKQEDRNRKEVMGKVWGVDAIFKNVFTSSLGTIVSLEESPLQEDFLMAGTDDGLLQLTENGGQSWRKIEQFPGLPSTAYTTDIHASRHDVNTIYVSFNNHKYGDFKPYLFKSTDKGNSWASITNGIPERDLVWSVIQDHENENLLFAGTEFGLYYTLDGGQKWNKFNRIPTIAIRDLEIQRRENDLVAASFGRGFFIIDDYTPLRNMSTDVLGKAAHIFPVKDALQFNFASPIGRGSLGHSFFTSPNPRYGATINYTLKESMSSIRQTRMRTEATKVRNNEPVYYPSWEALAKEKFEERSAIIFSIKDSNGNLIRRITGPSSKGLHSINWDLRMNRIGAGRGGRPATGPMVVPGTYSVSMSKIDNGVWTDFQGSESFEVKSLNNTTLPSTDRNALLAFQLEVSQLNSDVGRASGQVQEALAGLTRTRQNLINSASPDASKVRAIHDLRQEFLELNVKINGQSTMSDNAELIDPSIRSRANRASRSGGTTSDPTTTHKDNYEIAKKQLTAFQSELNDLMNKLRNLTN